MTLDRLNNLLETISIIPEVILGVGLPEIKYSVVSSFHNFVPQNNLVQLLQKEIGNVIHQIG